MIKQYAPRIGSRIVAAAARLAAVGGVLWVSACGDPDRPPAPVDAATIELISSRTLEPASDSSPWVTEVTAVFEHQGEVRSSPGRSSSTPPEPCRPGSSRATSGFTRHPTEAPGSSTTA